MYVRQKLMRALVTSVIVCTSSSKLLGFERDRRRKNKVLWGPFASSGLFRMCFSRQQISLPSPRDWLRLQPSLREGSCEYDILLRLHGGPQKYVYKAEGT